MLREINHADTVLAWEFGLGLIIGALALGCVVNWFRVWRHDDQGHTFFAALTTIAVLVTLALFADWTRRAFGL